VWYHVSHYNETLIVFVWSTLGSPLCLPLTVSLQTSCTMCTLCRMVCSPVHGTELTFITMVLSCYDDNKDYLLYFLGYVVLLFLSFGSNTTTHIFTFLSSSTCCLHLLLPSLLALLLVFNADNRTLPLRSTYNAFLSLQLRFVSSWTYGLQSGHDTPQPRVTATPSLAGQFFC
jgi:hypothetical protein